MTEGHNVYIRNVDPDTYAKLRQGAAARGMTIGTYLAKLVELHEYIRDYRTTCELTQADLDRTLRNLGLQTVNR